jgi:hypothetical protein
MPLQPPQSVKALFTFTFTPSHVLIERRGVGGLNVEVVERDDNMKTKLADIILSADPQRPNG